jgi:protein-disulfide isomerase
MKAKEIWIWIGIIVILFATLWGLIVLINPGSPNNSTPKVSTPAPATKADITLGTADKAKATLIEYADFQCPACAVFSQFVDQARKDFGDNLLIVYRFLPLIDAHKNAMTSAQAGFAAYKQNRFWEMNALLYQNQNSWAESDNAQTIFTGYAKKLNLNLDQFAKDYNSDVAKKFIEAERTEGVSIGITFTPSFFIDGKLIENVQSYDAFKQIIQNAINK